MIYPRSKVLLPEWLLKQQNTVSEQDFLPLVKEYLIRYSNYQFIKLEIPFAICDRIDDKKA